MTKAEKILKRRSRRSVRNLFLLSWISARMSRGKMAHFKYEEIVKQNKIYA